MPVLSQLHRCFQGVLPSLLATASRDGTPNVTYLSQVFYVDAQHVALSFQFFNKTRKNIAENPFACVQLYDPVTFQAYQLDLEYRRSETQGPLFDAMAARIEAIASHTGMSGIFRLIGADIYFVRAIRELEGLLDATRSRARDEESPPSLRSEIAALSTVSLRLREARDVDSLLGALLGALRDALGFEHAMVLLPDEKSERLYAVASVGYGDPGIGAEVALGEGLIGSVAERKKTVRIAHVQSELRYGRAIRHATEGARPLTEAREIPLPGLPDARSQLAIPLVSQGRLLGVLAVESRRALDFEDWHEAFLDIVGAQAASALENMMLRAEAEEARELPKPADPPQCPREERRRRSFCFFKNDDCVFVDGEYLIRNLPGRILWKILKSHEESGRVDFNNRELRLDPTLGLPPIKDNLESRLILLRKRLELKCAGVRLSPKARGQFRLELDCDLELTEKESG